MGKFWTSSDQFLIARTINFWECRKDKKRNFDLVM